MIKPIFEDEEDARKLLAESICDDGFFVNKQLIDACVERLKDKGYIKPNVVEAAEKIHQDMMSKGGVSYFNVGQLNLMFGVLYEAIQYLKQKLQEVTK